MSVGAFLGDEVSAAGFRLAGLTVHVPTPAETPDLFERLCGEVPLILLTAEVADWLPDALLQQRLQDEWPLVLVVADLRNRRQPADLTAALRRQLGLVQ